MSISKLIVLVAACLLTACQHKQLSDAEYLIDKAEAAMSTQPDSALLLLQQVAYAEELDGELQARYCLLLMQAKDKNKLYIMSDSLINIARHYYEQSQDSLRKAQALYYTGRVFEERKEDDKAINCFLQALNALARITDNNLSGLLYSHLGNLYINGNLYTDALEAHKQACHYAQNDGDTLGVALSLRDIGFTYLLTNQTDSMLLYYDRALETVRQTTDQKSISAILSEMGFIYIEQGRPNQAIDFVLQSLELDTDTLDLYPSYLTLGYIYSNLKQYNEAEYWLQKSISDSRPDTKREAYKLLYLQEKGLGSHQKALDYLEQYTNSNTEIEKQRWEENILDIQQKYESERLKNIAQQAENRTLRHQTISLAVITILLLLIGLLWWVHQYTKKKSERELQKIRNLVEKNYKDLETYRSELYRSEEKEEQLREQLAQNEQEIAENQKKNLEKHNRLLQFNQKLLVEMELLQMQQKSNEKKSAGILKENALLQQQLTQKEHNRKDPLIELIRNLKYHPTHIKSESDWELLRQFENLYFNSFVDKLDDYSNLTQREKEVCYLVRLGLANPDIATVLCIDSLSVAKYKARAKDKVSFQSKNPKTLEVILQTM